MKVIKYLFLLILAGLTLCTLSKILTSSSKHSSSLHKYYSQFFRPHRGGRGRRGGAKPAAKPAVAVAKAAAKTAAQAAPKPAVENGKASSPLLPTPASARVVAKKAAAALLPPKVQIPPKVPVVHATAPPASVPSVNNLKNDDWLSLGYNVIKGNPYFTKNNIDPGFPSNRLFTLTYDAKVALEQAIVPDSFTVVMVQKLDELKPEIFETVKSLKIKMNEEHNRESRK